MASSARSLALLLLLTNPGLALAQFPNPKGPVFSEHNGPGPYAERDRARARFAATQGDPRTRLLGMREAAAVEYVVRLREFLTGRGTLHFLLESLHRLLEVELLLCDTPADQTAVYEMIWVQALEVEAITRARYIEGRVAIQDLPEAEDYRLEAEMGRQQARARGANAPGVPQSFRSLRLLDDLGFDEISVREVRRRARARFEAVSADPATVARQRLKIAGRGTLDFNLGAARRLLLAGCAAYSDPADQLPFYERYWLQTRVLEWINQARYDAGRVAIQDLLQSTKERATAELALLEARARAPRKRPSPFPLRGEILEMLAFVYPGSGSALGRMKHEPGATPPQKLARIRRDAALGETDACLKEFMAGRGTLHFLLESARSLLDAERALEDQPAKQQAALERHWTLMWQIEDVSRLRFENGRVSFMDLARSRFHRLEAELWLDQRAAKRQP